MRRLPLPTIVDPPCSGRVDNAGHGAESRRGRLYLFLRYFTTSQRCWVALLHCTGGDTLRQLALEDDEEDDGRDDAQQRSRCQRGRFHGALALQGGECQRNGLYVIAHEERHRNHVFVPRPHEEEHEQHADGRPRNWQHHLAQDLPARGAVDGRGLKDGLRERAVYGGQQIGAVGALDDGEDDDDDDCFISKFCWVMFGVLIGVIITTIIFTILV